MNTIRRMTLYTLVSGEEAPVSNRYGQKQQVQLD